MSREVAEGALGMEDPVEAQANLSKQEFEKHLGANRAFHLEKQPGYRLLHEGR